MADNVTITDATSAAVPILTDEVTTVNGGTVTAAQAQVIKLAAGASGIATYVDTTNPLPVSITSGAATSTVVAVTAATSVVTIRAAASGRAGLFIYNDSTATLYVKFGTAASLTDWTVKIVGDGFYEMPEPVYRGIVTGIWSAANGQARVTELT